MNDDEIANALAQKMGWERLVPDKGVTKGIPFYGPDETGAWIQFSPATDWHHCGLALQWAQEQFGPFETGIGTKR